MANSKITITWLLMPGINEEFKFGEATYGLELYEKFRQVRNGSFQCKIPPAYSIGTEEDPEIAYGGFISENYKTAFNLDYNGTGLFTVSAINGTAGSGLGSVVITANYPGAVFEEIDTPTEMEVLIENEPAPESFEITEVTFSEADTDPCSMVNVTVTTSALATQILSPNSYSGNMDNPYSFVWQRGEPPFTVTVQNAEGTQASLAVPVPAQLLDAYYSINIVNSPNGATVTISNTNSTGLELEYSLDGTEWQESNMFQGLANDDYTLYVRDQLGCSFQMTFTVSEFGIYTPYFYISKSNSIRFAKRVTWGDSANYKNDENTLSDEVDVDEVYKEIQQFQSADIITTQIKSNYGEILATVIRENGSEVPVTVNRKTSNIGLKEKRDAKQYDYGNGMTGIYFLSGNIYDYDTNAVTDTYALNGALPVWAVAGNYIVIDNAWFLIEDIVYDESRDAEVLLITSNYSGPEINIIAGIIYNLFNYEVYEFDIDMAAYIDENIRVRLNNNSDGFPSLVHLSEQINVQVRHEDTMEIKYWNVDNTDVVYATGIRHKIRQQKFREPAGSPNDSSETYETDNSAILISSKVYEADTIEFEPVTKEIMRKIVLALAHENVFIDEVGYVKNESPGVEGPLEKSNLYVIKARMIKTGAVYNNQGSDGGLYNGENTEVPGLIDFNGGLVRY